MMEVMGVVIDSGFRQLGLLGEQAQAPVAKPGTTPAPAPRSAPAPTPTPRR
jgi:biopolymer transport protein TolR